MDRVILMRFKKLPNVSGFTNNNMKKRTTHNLLSWLIYSVMTLFILIPFDFSFLQGVSLSLLIGLLFACLNTIITELRVLNGEEFESFGTTPNIDGVSNKEE